MTVAQQSEHSRGNVCIVIAYRALHFAQHLPRAQPAPLDSLSRPVSPSTAGHVTRPPHTARAPMRFALIPRKRRRANTPTDRMRLDTRTHIGRCGSGAVRTRRRGRALPRSHRQRRGGGTKRHGAGPSACERRFRPLRTGSTLIDYLTRRYAVGYLHRLELLALPMKAIRKVGEFLPDGRGRCRLAVGLRHHRNVRVLVPRRSKQADGI